jgi:hypothetical protein
MKSIKFCLSMPCVVLFAAAVRAQASTPEQQICDRIAYLKGWLNSLPPGNPAGTPAEREQFRIYQDASQRIKALEKMKPMRIKVVPREQVNEGADAITSPEWRGTYNPPGSMCCPVPPLFNKYEYTPEVGAGDERVLIPADLLIPRSDPAEEAYRQFLLSLILSHEGRRCIQDLCSFFETDVASKVNKKNWPAYSDAALKDLKARYENEVFVWKVDLALIEYMIQDIQSQIQAAGSPPPPALTGALELLLAKRDRWRDLLRQFVALKQGVCQELSNRNL